MKRIAIHHREGSFSEGWIQYCNKNGIDYKIVNAYANDIIKQIDDCDIFLWHHSHAIYEDVIVAKKLLFALEQSGTIVYPNFNTGWHFDDKVAQKYLLEAIDAPIVPSYVFYNKKDAKAWAKMTTYPKVFKLKGGAGASNVKLVKNQAEALKLINQAFGKGFAQFDRLNNLKERYNKYRSGQDSLLGISKGVGRLVITPNFAKQQPPEKGYAYFQDFIPNNDYDIRVIVIDGKAFAIKRLVRENDFRASGSGSIIYKKSDIDLRCIELAFNISDRLNSQCLAYDFVFNLDNKPLIVEISYGFSVKAYDFCLGYWDNHMRWNQDQFNPQEWIINLSLKQIKDRD